MKTKIFKSLFPTALIVAISFVLDPAPAAACHPLNPFCRRPQGIIMIPSPIIGPQMSPENPNESWWRTRGGASRGELKLTTLYVSSWFKPEDADFIGRAFDLAITRMQDSSVRSCTVKYTNKEYFQGDINKFYWGVFQRKVLHVSPLVGVGRNTLANANINSADRKEFIHIRINANGAAVLDRDVDQLAGAIVHEIVHTFGHGHTKYSASKNWDDAYGTFVYEAGWCVGRAGRDKRGNGFNLLGDPTDPLDKAVD